MERILLCSIFAFEFGNDGSTVGQLVHELAGKPTCYAVKVFGHDIRPENVLGIVDWPLMESNSMAKRGALVQCLAVTARLREESHLEFIFIATARVGDFMIRSSTTDLVAAWLLSLRHPGIPWSCGCSFVCKHIPLPCILRYDISGVLERRLHVL